MKTLIAILALTLLIGCTPAQKQMVRDVLITPAEAKPSPPTEFDIARKESFKYLPAETLLGITREMYISYRRRFVDGMLDIENQCFDEIAKYPNSPNMAAIPALAAMTGSVIEAGYAREQGRMAHLSYQGPIMRARIEQRLLARGYTTEEIKFVFDKIVGPRSLDIVFGLAAVGMPL